VRGQLPYTLVFRGSRPLFKDVFVSDPSSKESWMSAAESSLRLMLSHSTVSRITIIMTSRPRRSLQAFPNPALIALTELRRILTDLRGSLADIRRILSNQQARLQDVTQHLASLKASTALSSDNNWRTRIDCGKRFCQAQIDGDKEAAEYWRKLGDETYAGEEREMPTPARIRQVRDQYWVMATKFMDMPSDILSGWKERFDTTCSEMMTVLEEHAIALDHSTETGDMAEEKQMARIGLREYKATEDVFALLKEMGQHMERDMLEEQDRIQDSLDQLEHLEATLARFSVELYRRTRGNGSAPRRRS